MWSNVQIKKFDHVTTLKGTFHFIVVNSFMHYFTVLVDTLLSLLWWSVLKQIAIFYCLNRFEHNFKSKNICKHTVISQCTT
jgi:hypothetical protein